VNSRAKGARVELAAAAELNALGLSARRTVQYQGLHSDGDVVVDGVSVHLEVKSRAEIHCYRWMEQAIDDARRGRMPALLMKADRKPWLLCFRLTDLPCLFKAMLQDPAVRKVVNEWCRD